MYAIIKQGGKQYRVSVDQLVQVEKIDAPVGDTVTLNDVLMVVGADGQIQVGTPTVGQVTVSAEVVAQGRDKKIHILKFKRRKHHMKQMGHRQYITTLKIKDIHATSE